MRLAKKADVVVENFPARPSSQSSAIDYDSVRKVNPGALSMAGNLRFRARTAPITKRPGFDQIAQGMGGLMSVTGAPGEGPMRGRHSRGPT